MDEMPGIPNPRVRSAWRHFVRRPSEHPPRVAPPEDDMQALLTSLAEQFERGAALERDHAAGVFGPDDDDPWAPPDLG